MRVEVCYCQPDEQEVVELDVAPGCLARTALVQSGCLARAGRPAIESASIGIFGKKCTLETILGEGDRLEIYRALHLSPTQARKLRAAKQKVKTLP